MQFHRKDHTYTLSQRDLTVLEQARVSILETANVIPRHPGLPPLWSKMAYVMLQTDHQTKKQTYWRSYRELQQLLSNVDSHYRRGCIPKHDGDVRVLRIPDYDLAWHQHYILREILYHIPVSPHACAYRKGQGLVQLAKPHKGHRVLVHLDIRDFFSSITEQAVFDALVEHTGYPKSVAGFLSRLCCHHHRLPQGACTSPALSNICFKNCDDALAALADEGELTYTRYADDLYFSGEKVDAGWLIREVKTILKDHGFRLNPKKTRVLGQHQAQKVTAIVVNEKLQVSRQYRRQLRQELHYLALYGTGAKAAGEFEFFEDYLQQLLGRISFVLYVDPTNQEFRTARERLELMLYDHFRLPF